jgi:hypothetical protein
MLYNVLCKDLYPASDAHEDLDDDKTGKICCQIIVEPSAVCMLHMIVVFSVIKEDDQRAEDQWYGQTTFCRY